MILKRSFLFIFFIIAAACVAVAIIPDGAFSRGVPLMFFHTTIIVNIHLMIIVLIGIICFIVPMKK